MEHNDGGRVFKGERALAAKWQTLSENPSYEELTVFQTYRHWLGNERQIDLDRLVRNFAPQHATEPGRASSGA